VRVLFLSSKSQVGISSSPSMPLILSDSAIRRISKEESNKEDRIIEKKNMVSPNPNNFHPAAQVSKAGSVRDAVSP